MTEKAGATPRNDGNRWGQVDGGVAPRAGSTNAPLWSDRHLDVLVGDALDVLATLPSESVHCMVTSPPYWGLRDYGGDEWEGGDPDHAHRGRFQRTAPPGTAKQATNVGANEVRSGDCECGARRPVPLGLEDDPEDFVDRLVAIFREARRVLRKDGTLWMNLGDTYGGSSGASAQKGLSASADLYSPRSTGPRELNRAERGETPHAPRARRGVRDKDLVGIPWRVALAMQEDGWYLRADVIWSKPNPMPSSTTDRPTVSHEYVFLLTRSPRYFYDADAVREVTGREATWDEWAVADGRKTPPIAEQLLERGVESGWGRKRDSFTHPLGRNLRSVWTIATQPYRGAHFATYPEALVEPCVLAGTSAYGVCSTCGAPWRRVVEVDYRPIGKPDAPNLNSYRHNPDAAIDEAEKVPSGWMAGPGRHDAGPPPGRTEKTMTPEAAAAGQAPGPQAMAYGRAQKLVETVGWKPGCEHGGIVVAATVLDPFAGSGTTGAVAQRLGRRAILIDAKGDYLASQAMKRNEQIPLGLIGSVDQPALFDPEPVELETVDDTA